MDTIRIIKTQVEGNTITSDVRTTGAIREAFRDGDFQFTYECNIPMTGVPESIAVLPALGTLIPLSWLFDVELSVDECDADFAASLPDIKAGYQNMYPGLSFKGKINIGKCVSNPSEHSDKALCLFSGGLDSHDTALRHAAEKPDLLVLRGADISILDKDTPGWEEIVKQVDHLSSVLGVDRLSVVTNFRRAMNYRFLNKWTTEVASGAGSYWYCFQHGLAMITHAAPIVFQKKIGTVYIASSFTGDDDTACASSPTIDNYIRFCGAGVIHDGFEYNRLAKLRNVTSWAKEHDADLYLRVCHSHPNGRNGKTGTNCCRCEKCCRTILGIYALREDPRRYGFDVKDLETFGDIMYKNLYRCVFHFNTRLLPTIRLFHENYSEDEVPDSMRWVYDFKLDDNSEFFKWVDIRIARDAEKRVALSADQRKMESLREKLKECRKKNKELSEQVESYKSKGISHIFGKLFNK